jgi:His-Xaa-Ser system radical SAM maturase HxsC
MCSQPPKNTDDLDYYFAINKSLIGLMPKETEVIGITGGEPTILGDRLLELLELLNLLHPETTVHMLSNGRAFALKNYTQKISLTNNNLIIGIPLYSDNYLDHDFIVQAKDAFNQSIIGIHNLARFNVKIEIRIVLHKLTYERLPQIAKFIYKNFPFVEHIAFMGLEYVGYTPFNHDKLWIEPSRYMLKLEEATLFLDQMGMNISIYNLQHCLLKETLWKFSKKSISDWKRNYIDECTKCKKLEDCGGVFATSKVHSNEIKAIAQ